MHKKYKILAIFGIIVTLLFPQVILIAQEDNSEGELSSDIQGLDPSGVRSGELTNCFDTYKFGAEGISLTAGTNLSEYKPSDLVEVVGEIVNNNPYPIIDMTVKARVLRSHVNPVEQRALYTTIEEFILLENVTLKAKESYTLEHIYDLPDNAPTGNYRIQYYVYNQDRFALNGLSFTEDIIANSADFFVLNVEEHIYLDKANITVDGQINDTRGFITEHEKGKDIPIRLPLTNPTAVSKEMEINYKVYKWNEILENDFIEESTQQVTIEANSRIDLEYIVKNTIYPVYYVVITAMPIGQQYSDLNQEYTMAHIRFAIKDVNRPRISWIGLDKTPFNETDVNIILCAHNTNFDDDIGPIKVQSIARDDKGRELSKIEYEGLMPSAISGIKNKLNTDKKFNTVTIETNLYNASNELVDNIITKYDCNELSPELCVLESKYNNIIIIAVLILLGVLGGFISYKRYKRLKN